MKLFIVTMEDTITQIRDYAVLATDQADAERKIAQGEFLAEGSPETTGTTDCVCKSIVEINTDGQVV